MKKDNIFIISWHSFEDHDYQIMKSPEELTPKEFKKLLHKVQEEEWEKLREDLKTKKGLMLIFGDDLFSAMIVRLEEMNWKKIKYEEFGFCDEEYYDESENWKEFREKKLKEYEKRNKNNEE